MSTAAMLQVFPERFQRERQVEKTHGEKAGGAFSAGTVEEKSLGGICTAQWVRGQGKRNCREQKWRLGLTRACR